MQMVHFFVIVSPEVPPWALEERLKYCYGVITFCLSVTTLVANSVGHLPFSLPWINAFLASPPTSSICCVLDLHNLNTSLLSEHIADVTSDLDIFNPSSNIVWVAEGTAGRQKSSPCSRCCRQCLRVSTSSLLLLLDYLLLTTSSVSLSSYWTLPPSMYRPIIQLFLSGLFCQWAFTDCCVCLLQLLL